MKFYLSQVLSHILSYLDSQIKKIQVALAHQYPEKVPGKTNLTKKKNIEGHP
jgi:hypothetical protein